MTKPLLSKVLEAINSSTNIEHKRALLCVPFRINKDLTLYCYADRIGVIFKGESIGVITGKEDVYLVKETINKEHSKQIDKKREALLSQFISS